MNERNPFTVGQPVSPAQFIGRESELAAAFDQINSRSNLAIWGGSGVGKSSLLHKINDPQTWIEFGQEFTKAIIIPINCLSLTPFSANKFWQEILVSIYEKTDHIPGIQEQASKLLKQSQEFQKSVTKDDIRRILRHIGRHRKFLVLLVDDYDAAMQTSEEHYSEQDIEAFLSECRSLAYHSQERQHLSMIVASSRRLNELGPKLNPNASPWYNHYLFQPCRPFSQSEIDTLLENMTSFLRDSVVEITGNNPALIQIAAYLIYQARTLRTSNISDAESFARELESRTQHISEAIWQQSTEIEQTLMMLITLHNLRGRLHNNQFSLYNLELIFRQRERELNNLQERGILVYTASSQNEIKYSFSASLMERWITQEMSSIWANEIDLEKRQKVLLNLMSRQQVDTVSSLIRQVIEHREALPSALQWLNRIFKALPQGF